MLHPIRRTSGQILLIGGEEEEDDEDKKATDLSLIILQVSTKQVTEQPT
jgi:hypothetical protein